MLNLTLLGSGGGFPMPDRFLSSMIMSYKGRNILIDCGEGTQVAMRKAHTGFKATDIICITHFHGDHIFGLPGLLLTIGNSGRAEPITIIGPTGLVGIVEAFLAAIPYLPYDIKLIEAPEVDLGLNMFGNILCVDKKSSYEGDEIIISTLDLDHSSPCIGYSFYVPRRPKFLPEKAIEYGIPKEKWSILQSGKPITYKDNVYRPSQVLGKERRGIKLSYITDTRPIDEIVGFIEESNLFVCEGTYGDSGDIEKAVERKHMTFEEAAELARKGKVDKLLLTHFSPAMGDPNTYIKHAKAVFDNTIIGYDGYTKVLSYK
ncbi:MAG TPA: ribonuclease Z [Clostridiales bacterium]|nr:ribonuclease Z [Clostridiales bacterium]